MALVNIDNILQETLRAIKNCPANSGIELMSYKRNRSISLIRLSDTTYLFEERGYQDQQKTIEHDQLSKMLKQACKREFPRSRKVRMFKITEPSQLDRHHQKI